MSFKDVTMTVLTMDKQVLTNYVVESPEGSKIINITDGATNTLITSLASTKLSSNQGKTSSAVTSARATQLWNETDGSSEATIINANPHFKTLSSSQHHVQALIQKYGIKVERSYTNLSTSITKGELEIISNLGTTLTIIEED
ncbi:hypothetical protein H8D85_01685 [bacterium]|nr:hypothetical protein [bacterium]